MLKTLALQQSQKWHEARFQFFHSVLQRSASPVRSIVDLGGYNGRYMAAHAHLLAGTEIIVADIDKAALKEARRRFGFKTIKLAEEGPLPFADQECDFIFCNSVIEHVTGFKSGLWGLTDDRLFQTRAQTNQAAFAAEIRRAGRGYFVQTPHKSFPVESHAWLPLVQFLPRSLLIPVLKTTNRFWVKQTTPDWRLMGRQEMQRLFPDATIVTEKVLGVPKSLIAYRNSGTHDTRTGRTACVVSAGRGK